MIDLGDVYQVAVDIYSAGGVLTDPATATLTITLPDGTTATPAVSLPSSTAGQLRVDYTTTMAGRHSYRMVTTVPATAHTGVFDVRSAAPDLIVSLEDAKTHLNITSTTSDEELRSMIESVTAVVEQYVGAVVRRTEVEVFDGGRAQLTLSHIPVISVTSVVDTGATVSASSYTFNATSGVLTQIAGPSLLPFLVGVQSVTVTYVAGRTTVPANIRMAALLILQHMWESQRPAAAGPFSQGSDDYDPRYSYSVPRRALELLGEPIGGFA